MADIQRHGPKASIIPKKPDGNVVLWQASDGSLYALSNADGFNAAIKSEYGEKAFRKIAGIITKETLDATFSVIRTAPTAGAASWLAIVGVKILAKGTSSSLKDAISGEQVDLKSIGANYGKELLKPSNFAPTDMLENPTRSITLQSANGVYKYKKAITSNDPGISKIKLLKIKDIDGKEPDYLLKGDVSLLSIGKQFEKGAITKLTSQKLNHKPEDDYNKLDLSKYAQNWDSTDIENFERFVAQGFTIEEAVSYTNQRNKGLAYSVNQFTEAFQSQETNIFTQGVKMGKQSLAYNWDSFQENSKKSERAFTDALFYGDFKALAAGGASIRDGILMAVDIIGIGVMGTFSAFGEAIQGAVGVVAKTGNIVTDVVSAKTARTNAEVTPTLRGVVTPLAPPKSNDIVVGGVRNISSVIKVTNERKKGEKVVVDVKTQAPVIKRSNSYLQPQQFDVSRTILQLR